RARCSRARRLPREPGWMSDIQPDTKCKLNVPTAALYRPGPDCALDVDTFEFAGSDERPPQVGDGQFIPAPVWVGGRGPPSDRQGGRCGGAAPRVNEAERRTAPANPGVAPGRASG